MMTLNGPRWVGYEKSCFDSRLKQAESIVAVLAFAESSYSEHHNLLFILTHALQ